MTTATTRHAATRSGHRAVRWIALGTTALLAFAGAGTVAAYVDLQSQMEVSDVDALLGRDAVEPVAEPAEEPVDPTDPFAGKARNILVMGTDFRDEENAAIAGAGDEFHSDTTLLVHISGDRSRIEAVSIPRDSLVDIPSCPRPDGSSTSPQYGAMFNTAFSLGGGPEKDITGAAACTILTVEALTGMRIHDHVVVKMSGVVDIVDALDGVPMCLPERVKGDERYSDLDLPAGRQTLDGETAIQFLRVRKGEGMGLELGSDLKRIERQQAFIDSMLREVLDQNVVTDTPKLYRMVRAALKAMSTSPDLGSPSALAGLAWSLKDVESQNIVFQSVPVVDSVSRPGRVEWTGEADEIWEKLDADVPLVEAPEPEPSDAPSDGTQDDGGSGTDGDETSPDDGTTDVEDGDGTDDLDDAQLVDAEPSPEVSLRPGVCA